MQHFSKNSIFAFIHGSMIFKKTITSFRFAINGIIDVCRHCNNMKIHLVAAAMSILLSIYLQLSTLEWCCILCCIFLVLAAEMLNSAIEYTVDLITSDYHELAKKAKDAGAGAVLLVSILALCIGCIIFIPKILRLL